MIAHTHCEDADSVGCVRINYDKVQCGLASKNLAISSHGVDTTPFSVPWMAAVMQVDANEEGGMKFLGSAVVVHSGVVLTASHLVDSFKASNLKVIVGAHDLKAKDEEAFARVQNVVKIILHPRYNFAPLINDLALLVLNTVIDTSTVVKPICLPEDDASFVNKTCIFSVWGHASDINGAVDNELEMPVRKVNMHVISNNVCQYDMMRSATFGPWLHMHSGFLCAIGDAHSNQRPCKGDAGGPLFCKVAETEGNEATFSLVGIASFGTSCAAGEEITPTVFMGIAKYSSWIDDVLGRLSDGFIEFNL
ncbi:hypothetical protein B566_EDAN011585 [Ephemera danica]|nr:hypothetical protein B566_EDAN011585 [Ephemera danica]